MTEQQSQCIFKAYVTPSLNIISYVLKTPEYMNTSEMDSTSNQFSGGCAKMEIKQVHVISSSEGEKGGEWGRERRAASREEGDDGENHGYKDGGWGKGEAQRGPPRGRGRMNSRMIEYSRKRDYLQWMLALLLWLGVWAGSSQTICAEDSLRCKTLR